jgi:hypothetical protein
LLGRIGTDLIAVLRTDSIARGDIFPARRRRGGATLTSSTVDTAVLEAIPPSRIRSTVELSCALTCGAVRAAAAPERLALVAVIGRPSMQARC